jgi:hypothetical protein
MVRNLALTLKAENMFRMFENRVVRRIFGLRRHEVMGS